VPEVSGAIGGGEEEVAMDVPLGAGDSEASGGLAMDVEGAEDLLEEEDEDSAVIVLDEEEEEFEKGKIARLLLTSPLNASRSSSSYTILGSYRA
jgi:hypothetical protein